MVSIETRKTKDGKTTSYRVKWRTGGTGAQDGTTFDVHTDAKQFKAAANVAGVRRCRPDFTDAPLYLPPVPAVAGSLGRTESVRMTTATCAAFLDTPLRGQSGNLPATLTRYGDLRVCPPATVLK